MRELGTGRTVDVTVITPTISGREHLLEECIESVKKQTIVPMEHRVKLDEHRVGPARIRNELAAGVRTEWITFLDDDDILLSNHFEIHNLYMKGSAPAPKRTCVSDLKQGTVESVVPGAEERWDVISTWCMMVHEPGNEVLFEGTPQPKRIMSGHNTLPITATVRTEMFNEVGGFNENVRFEDLVLWQDLYRAGARFKSFYIPTWHYRITPGGRNEAE